MADAVDALTIRRYVTAARRLRPDADLDGYADRAIRAGDTVERVACFLFGVVTAGGAGAPHVAFHRAPLPRVLSAKRRALS